MVVSEREIKQKKWAHGQLKKEKNAGFFSVIQNSWYSSKFIL